MNPLIKSAFVNSSLTALYILGISLLLFYSGSNELGKNFTFLIPLTMLSLFVFSAAITSFLIFGRPAMLYVDGKKKEALTLLMYTIGFFGAYTLLIITLLFLTN